MKNNHCNGIRKRETKVCEQACAGWHEIEKKKTLHEYENTRRVNKRTVLQKLSWFLFLLFCLSIASPDDYHVTKSYQGHENSTPPSLPREKKKKKKKKKRKVAKPDAPCIGQHAPGVTST